MEPVVMDAGYESLSGFREAFPQTFENSPGGNRSPDCIVAAWLESPLGPLVAGANAEGLCLLEFTERRRLESQLATLHKRFACAIVPGDNDHLDRLRDELSAYFSGTLRRFSVPLVYPGSSFERRVWNELLRIPYGATRSYDDLARAIRCPRGSRAVGGANGRNRIAIVIPCHRVVNKNGELGGYGGGAWRKQLLIDLEQTHRVRTR